MRFRIDEKNILIAAIAHQLCVSKIKPYETHINKAKAASESIATWLIFVALDF
ncbi:hypothetical protein [Comamonas testosteroni]|uniref:hypothetical protein n=1 Tax=Comamonas testosteroni TaxID=285 RepID=UPI000AAF8A49|nr:hypothetical protein [Comamonas testosteroni]